MLDADLVDAPTRRVGSLCEFGDVSCEIGTQCVGGLLRLEPTDRDRFEYRCVRESSSPHGGACAYEVDRTLPDGRTFTISECWSNQVCDPSLPPREDWCNPPCGESPCTREGEICPDYFGECYGPTYCDPTLLEDPTCSGAFDCRPWPAPGFDRNIWSCHYAGLLTAGEPCSPGNEDSENSCIVGLFCVAGRCMPASGTCVPAESGGSDTCSDGSPCVEAAELADGSLVGVCASPDWMPCDGLCAAGELCLGSASRVCAREEDCDPLVPGDCAGAGESCFELGHRRFCAVALDLLPGAPCEGEVLCGAGQICVDSVCRTACDPAWIRTEPYADGAFSPDGGWFRLPTCSDETGISGICAQTSERGLGYCN